MRSFQNGCSTPSLETQGQLVGSIKCPWWKFTVRSRRAPGHLLLTNQFQKRAFELPAPAWPQKFQPGYSDVFLHDVVFVVDRHNCVARSTGKVSRGQFFFSQGMLLLGSNHFLIYSFRTIVNDLWGKLRRVRKHHSHPAAPLRWLARKKFFWPIRSGQFKRFWNWFQTSPWCPGARLDLTLQ